MEKWFEPDSTWSALGYKTRDEYVQYFVIEGRFHSAVPEDVIKSYKTAEYLMAHAWYHYPMYDEVLKKLLGILEMAVKLKCQQLNIPVEDLRPNGRKISYKLVNLIDKICAQEPEKDLKNKLHWARERRNYFAHPERHSFMGFMASQPIIPLVNILNQLFLNIDIVLTGKDHLKQLEQTFAAFQEGLFVLEWKGKRFLVHKALPLKATQVNGIWYSSWSFQPVLNNTFDLLSQHKYPPKILLHLANIELKDSCLLATDFDSNSDIKLIISSNPLDLEKLLQYQADLGKLEESDRRFFEMYFSGEIAKKINKFEYTYRWGNINPILMAENLKQ